MPQVSPGEGSAASAAKEDVNQATLKKNIETYFKAIASNDASEVDSAMGTAAPGSIADVYLKYSSASNNAYQDAGRTFKPGKVTAKGDSWQYCDTTNVCVDYADIKASGDKIASFTVSGKDIKDRLLAGSGTTVNVGDLGEVQVLVSYQGAISNSLYITFRIKSGSAPIGLNYETAYRSAEGRQTQPSDRVGPSTLQPNSTAYYMLVIPKSTLGGDLLLGLYATDSSGGRDQVNIPIH
ncbi:MAG: hypothetical protein LLG14_16550 [Nocardiaceae bacterium]|nr:hypothetical protein [Nocardiaceae bacterium]